MDRNDESLRCDLSFCVEAVPERLLPVRLGGPRRVTLPTGGALGAGMAPGVPFPLKREFTGAGSHAGAHERATPLNQGGDYGVFPFVRGSLERLCIGLPALNLPGAVDGGTRRVRARRRVSPVFGQSGAHGE